MKTLQTNDFLIGTKGKVWLNGEYVSNLESIKITITNNFEPKFHVGDLGQKHIYTGWSGAGSITVTKINSKFLSLLGDSCKTGVMPEIIIETELQTNGTGKSERVMISDITITSFDLVNFNSNGSITEELPIQFSGYEILDTI